MSFATRVRLPRALVVGLAAVAAVPTLGMNAASAYAGSSAVGGFSAGGSGHGHDHGGDGPGGPGGGSGGSGGCPRLGALLQVSGDGGASWVAAGRSGGSLKSATIKVRLASFGSSSRNCAYDVSLVSYETQGPDWPSSGEQHFLGYDTTHLTASHREDTLSVTPAECFGQYDLYEGTTIFDGQDKPGHGPLPSYPDTATPSGLISAWNGKLKDCTTTPPTTPPATTPPASTPPATAAPPVTTSPTTTSPATTSASPSPTTSSPTTAAATSPVPTSSSVLPHTGADFPVGKTVGAALALLLIGGTAVYGSRQLRRRSH